MLNREADECFQKITLHTVQENEFMLGGNTQLKNATPGIIYFLSL